jgi:maltooligosyltrehalose trehalohydrolase
MTSPLALENTPPVLGARVDGPGTRFGLFADPAQACAVRVFDSDGGVAREEPMAPIGNGYFEAYLPDVRSGALYKLVVDGRELTDPYARFLPQGVDGPAQVMASSYQWRSEAGVSRPLGQHVIYELHVGTFSGSGTYDGVREHLSELVDLGVTALELLPLAAFPGARGWGYEGVALFAPFAPYGTPDDLRRLVDEAHGAGLSVILDVVYNHFGPAGNALPSYSPAYFTSEHRNAWGDAPNYAHPVVRRMILENAAYWLNEFRFDGLRLDATHAIVDPSKPHILDELADVVRKQRPRKLLIAEDNRNDPGVVKAHGLDAIWADDFHHQVRVTLTGERDGYYAAYEPGIADLAHVITRGWLYEGQPYAPSGGTPRGKSADDLEAPAFVYCLQNHDQIGNRALGERLSAVVSAEQYRAVSTLLLFLPMTPMLFMGQEWAASSPFLFFTDHDAELGRLISEGRREEFASFAAFADPEVRARIPDPQAVTTFELSKVPWAERDRGEHGRVLALHKRLLALRKSDPVLRAGGRRQLTAEHIDDVLVVVRRTQAGTRTLLVNFGERTRRLVELAPSVAGRVLLRSDLGPLEGVELPKHTAIIVAA